jgi:hypothetical protein
MFAVPAPAFVNNFFAYDHVANKKPGDFNENYAQALRHMPPFAAMRILFALSMARLSRAPLS